jgi:hypothetical protein
MHSRTWPRTRGAVQWKISRSVAALAIGTPSFVSPGVDQLG